jgi:hypothetical protein
MGDSVLDEVKVAVQVKVEAKGREWDNDDWSPFLNEVVGSVAAQRKREKEKVRH